jgi:uncharacterized membrane protein
MSRGLHWANLGILFTVALLPFATAVGSAAMQQQDLFDQRTAVGLYALVGAVHCVRWLVFFRYLAPHPQVLPHRDHADFFHSETKRAWIGILAYTAAGVLDCLTAPEVALAIFLILPIFYGITSPGLYELRVALHRRHLIAAATIQAA